MFLHGNFKECSLPDLLSMLASKAETGRLDINLEESPTAQLYLMNGKPVDCCLGYLRGLEALDVLLTYDEGTFRFSSGIVPPNLMFRNGRERNLAGLGATRLDAEPTQEREAAEELGSAAQSTNGKYRGAPVIAVLASLALGVGLTIGSVIASIQHSAKAEATVLKSESRIEGAPVLVPRTSSKEQPRSSPSTMPVRTVQPSNKMIVEDPDTTKLKQQSPKVVSIPVIVRIEDGRVVEAYAAKPEPGQEAFEATAVRLARQRRFNTESGTETIVLTISEK